ncbi:PocR ligand-binding domain-containing protein [Williamwhitmania taraxaci]|uniref:histidine kinase n=1 Tax=Williamwhitmania taraxaci TaxID=1640674 RepID=A0A1G6NXW8_9BACT|nr:PocR ligand-binding domain-containing protein [Williamwhitmania taraxaci]SDC72077.1 PAS domain S-box-containing protein [Williamwhitmania taraxaci]
MEKHISEIIDISGLNLLLEKYTVLTHMGTAVLDLEGKVLIATGWQDICTKFHRINKDTCKNCVESDTSLANNIKSGMPFNMYKCLNGMTDVAFPIKINNEQVGTFFIGQFLSEKPDLDFFKKQAHKYGFDEEKYLKALSNVPVISDEDVKKSMDFLSQLTLLIGEMGLVGLQLIENELLKAKEIAEKSEIFLNNIINSMGDPVFVKDDQSRLLIVNDAFCKIFDLGRSDIIGKTLAEDVTPEERESFLRIDKQVLIDGKENINEELLTVRDGQSRTISTRKTRFSDNNGNKFLVGSIRDISDLKGAEEALQAKIKDLNGFFSVVLDLLCIADTDGNFRLLNPAWEKTLGYTMEELMAKPFLDFTHPDDLQPTLDVVSKLASQEAVICFVNRYRCKDGTYRWLEWQSAPSGKLIYAAARDITDRKLMEEKLNKYVIDLKRSNEELEQFAYVASHDLQEPLRMVSSFTQLLEQKYSDKLDTDAHDFIHFAVDGANRMQMLINDLLEFSRVTTRGKEFIKLDTSSVLGQAINNLHAKITETCAIVTSDDLPFVVGDESQLIRLFQNLIDNAIKFRSEGTSIIHISCHSEAGYHQFSVKDNGIGIAPQYFERIFQIFQRLHTKVQYPGTGVGLAICKRIIERHNGKIWLESEVGKGTTFYFTINK